jgi:7-keto-8-aminopelargonate synthetase-like enzyme
VPADSARLRVTLSAGHTTADVARLLDNINEVNAHMERSRDGA